MTKSKEIEAARNLMSSIYNVIMNHSVEQLSASETSLSTVASIATQWKRLSVVTCSGAGVGLLSIVKTSKKSPKITWYQDRQNPHQDSQNQCRRMKWSLNHLPRNRSFDEHRIKVVGTSLEMRLRNMKSSCTLRFFNRDTDALTNNRLCR